MDSAAGYGERRAFLYDTERVQPSGLVGEIVLPPIEADPEHSLPARRTSPVSAGPGTLPHVMMRNEPRNYAGSCQKVLSGDRDSTAQNKG